MPESQQNKQPTSFRLSPEGLRLLKALAERHGISQAGWLEMVIRREARREGAR